MSEADLDLDRGVAYQYAKDTWCPTCGAAPGNCCTSNLNYSLKKVHAKRVEASPFTGYRGRPVVVRDGAGLPAVVLW